MRNWNTVSDCQWTSPNQLEPIGSATQMQDSISCMSAIYTRNDVCIAWINCTSHGCWNQWHQWQPPTWISCLVKGTWPLAGPCCCWLLMCFWFKSTERCADLWYGNMHATRLRRMQWSAASHTKQFNRLSAAKLSFLLVSNITIKWVNSVLLLQARPEFSWVTNI